MNMDTKEIIKDIKVKELISGIVDNISPTCYYPVLYSRKQMEWAMEELAKKVMEMQTDKIKKMEKRVSNKEQAIQRALDEYRRRSKQIKIDAITGHLDRMEDVECEYMIKEILEKVYDAAKMGM